MTRLFRIAAAIALSVTAASALAADVAAGKARAAQCAACHGSNGMATQPETPNLAGQVESYLVKALKDYRSGSRKHEQMTLMARPLSDSEIANLAAFFSSLPAGGSQR